ncbi:unnamed protein product [Aphanomyces euteiches]
MPKAALTPGALVKAHDISTKQLMDDALVDHDVSESGGDSDEEPKPTQPPRVQTVMYKINSYTALTKLDKSKPEGRVSVKQNDQAGACSRCVQSKDMPSVHFAAYAGHASCLAKLLKEPNGGAVVDKHHRTPLFYACASNQADCCSLLLENRRQWIDIADAQLDTPVHVCCFFGWDACLEKLLDAGANPHVRNAKGFRPSHITKTPACLKILVTHGDDLLQGDKLGRTPLFVACTRNRVDCVAFLCQWDYQVHSWMLEQEDDRSDRPIHAAACNGSVGCLEVLVKYGADVFAKNARGLTALDLAVTNHHSACVELLQKAITDSETSSTWFHQPYSRLDNNRPQTSSEWSECTDAESGYIFFYNNLTGKCQWEKPDGCNLNAASDVTVLSSYVSPHGAQATPTTDQSTPPQQQQSSDDDGGGDYVWVKKKKKTITVVASTQSEWMVVQDPGSKALYYKNTITGESQWEEPEAIQKLQHDAQAHTSQHAQELWDELNKSRDTLAAKIEEERQRQANLTAASIAAFQASIQSRREEMHHKELKTLLPKSSFAKPKLKPMSMRGSMMKLSMHTIEDVENENADDPVDSLTKLCDDEPFLSLFLGSFIRYDTKEPPAMPSARSKRSVHLDMTGAQRIYNGLFHYYLTLIDPFNVVSMTYVARFLPLNSHGSNRKAQFRVLLKDAYLLPNAASNGVTPPLKLHAADMIFALVATEQLDKSTPSFSPRRQVNVVVLDGAKEMVMVVSGFYKAMLNVGERAVALLDEKAEAAIDDVDVWFCTEYMLPLLRRLASKMAENVKRYKEIDADMTGDPHVVALVSGNRSQLHALHRYYSSDSRFKLMTFDTLSQFAADFGLTPLVCSVSALFHICEAINWINGHSYTVVISFEKFVQICRTIAALYPQDGASGVLACWQGFLSLLNNRRHNRATTRGHGALVFIPLVVNPDEMPMKEEIAAPPPATAEEDQDPNQEEA